MTPTRAYIAVGGDDRIAFLQGILTQDVSKLADEKIQFAALLSPQGKILHDMFLIDRPDHVVIDTDAASKELLLKCLTMYKLRAKVHFDDTGEPKEILPDPRHPQLPPRGAGNLLERLALGIPEFGRDIAPDSMTAMDAGYDLLNAISFTKGCYVGQEVTARMHYKNIARKGFFLISAMDALPDGGSIMAGGRAIGDLRTVSGTHGLAFLKFEDAVGSNASVDNRPVRITAPGWMQPKLALFEEASAKQ
jgi:hypothetical protein